MLPDVIYHISIMHFLQGAQAANILLHQSKEGYVDCNLAQGPSCEICESELRFSEFVQIQCYFYKIRLVLLLIMGGGHYIVKLK